MESADRWAPTLVILFGALALRLRLVGDGVDSAPYAVDPAKAERLIERLGIRDADAAQAMLLEPDNQLLLAVMMRLQPITKRCPEHGTAAALEVRSGHVFEVPIAGQVSPTAGLLHDTTARAERIAV